MIELLITNFIKIRLLDVIDILLVAFLLYAIYRLIKGTVAIRIFIGIISFYLIWKLVKVLQMELLSEILGSFISVGVIALLIVFQQEIRKFLLLLGTPSFIGKNQKRFLFWKFNIGKPIELDIDSIIKACQNMAKTKTGALIIITNKNELLELNETGEIIDANISNSLIESIFYKNNPLHDGAIIIRKNQITSASCVLPLSKKLDFPTNYGLRHRAAVGITEQSDAIAIIVSEQTGKIAYSKAGELKTNISLTKLEDFLNNFFPK